MKRSSDAAGGQETNGQGPAALCRPVEILGLPVHPLTMEGAVAAICRAWQEERVFQVITANVEILAAGLADGEVGRLIREGEMVTADGAGVLLAARLSGFSLPERVAGYDLLLAALKEAERQGVSVFFLGARPEVLQAALARIRELFPHLLLCGSHHGYFREEEEAAIAAEIKLRRPRLLVVALGAPRQDKWIYRHKRELPPCVAMGVGGSLDVLAGKARRAPRWMQRAGLEWLYRLLRQPSRLARVYVIPLFLFKVLGKRLAAGSRA